jgi:hypothetical protein
MKKIWIPQIVVSSFLLWALSPTNPYAYYVLLRWICCAIFIFLTMQAKSQMSKSWTWILGFIAVLYNPLVPVHLDRLIWSVVNVVVIGVAFASIFALKRDPNPIINQRE